MTTSPKLVGRAFAKVNLGLEVVAKRDDGYHELRTILQTIDLHDELTFERTSGEIVLSTNDADIGAGADNLVHRAASALMKDSGVEGVGAAIHVEKRIPAGMGLGGGSADAALTLVALDRLWELETPAPDLHRVAASIGMDVPFFLYGGTAIAVGRGDEVYPLAVDTEFPIVLILPDFSISTASVYSSLILTKRRAGLTLQHFAWRSPSVGDRLGELVNHLEEATGSHASSIDNYKRMLLGRGADAASMSGSGASVFGVFKDDESAHAAADSLTREGLQAVFARTISRDVYRENLLRVAPGDPVDPTVPVDDW